MKTVYLAMKKNSNKSSPVLRGSKSKSSGVHSPRRHSPIFESPRRHSQTRLTLAASFSPTLILNSSASAAAEILSCDILCNYSFGNSTLLPSLKNIDEMKYLHCLKKNLVFNLSSCDLLPWMCCNPFCSGGNHF